MDVRAAENQDEESSVIKAGPLFEDTLRPTRQRTSSALFMTSHRQVKQRVYVCSAG